MLRSTFLGYKTATSALKVSQNFMDVVGQNMSNIDTPGYTRQRLDISSVGFTARNLKYGLDGVVIGQGVDSVGVSQYRDSFLDLRYRMAAAKTGCEEVQYEALSDLELILDEISTEGLDAQFSDLLTQLHSLTSNPSDPVLEGVVRSSAQLLTQMFNNYSERISTVRDQQLNYLNDGAIVKVNQLMDNIAKLNEQIKESNISGNPALELNDERNMLIDELSTYLDIEVSINQKNIGGNNTVDELSIYLKLPDNNKVLIVDKNKSATFNSSVPTDETDVKVELEGIDGIVSDLTDKIESGKIGGYIKFLNGKGEFADSVDVDSKNKGVQYYLNMLDTLANKFATVMNELNDPNPLFESRDGYDITAENIKISDEWSKATDSYIKNSTIPSEGNDNTGATDNILRMINAFKNDQDFTTKFDGSGNGLFKGSFQEFMTFTTTRLNLQVDDTEKSYDNYFMSQYQIDYARSSLSSVDLNEEGVNMLQYSKSYNAAARLMTTLDEMLDTLINRMGV